MNHADSINGLDGDEDSVIGGTSSEKEISPSRGPNIGTRSRNKAGNESAGSECPKQRKKNRIKKKSYCLCKKQNLKGLMVQCDFCKDWFHPGPMNIN